MYFSVSHHHHPSTCIGPSTMNNNNNATNLRQLLCEVCGTEVKKYKCPTCGLSYCTVKCFKAHKDGCLLVQSSSSSSSVPPEVLTGLSSQSPPHHHQHHPNGSMNTTSTTTTTTTTTHASSGAIEEEDETSRLSRLSEETHLHRLRESPTLVQALRDPRLQRCLLAIDAATDRAAELERIKRMEGDEFHKFLDEILVTIGVAVREEKNEDGTGGGGIVFVGVQ